VVVVVAGELGMSRSTLVGVVVGAALMLLLLVVGAVLVTLAVRRRRLKGHPGAVQSTPGRGGGARCTSSRSTTSVSTISAAAPACNGSVLASSLSGVSLAPPPSLVAAPGDNVAYTDEPPPPYSSVRSPPPPPHGRLVRDRPTGRSLPPTPTRRGPAAVPPGATGQRRPDSLSEHIYDEPSTLLAPPLHAACLETPLHGTRLEPPLEPPFQGTCLETPLDDTCLERPLQLGPPVQGTCPRSWASRVRLGTTALRPATLRGHPSPRSVSRRQRPAPRGFGTHQPRAGRSAAASPSSPAARPPFNSTPCPSPAECAAGAGLYDEPWDSGGVMDRVAIPLTAMPPAWTAGRSASATLDTTGHHRRRHRPSQFDVRLAEPGLSDWGGPHAGRVTAWPCVDTAGRRYLDPAGRRYLDPGVGRYMGGDSTRRRSASHQPPPHAAADLSDSSSSPLVAEPPRGQLLDLLGSPTCV